jgi:hypothetical protein
MAADLVAADAGKVAANSPKDRLAPTKINLDRIFIVPISL